MHILIDSPGLDAVILGLLDVHLDVSVSLPLPFFLQGPTIPEAEVSMAPAQSFMFK